MRLIFFFIIFQCTIFGALANGINELNFKASLNSNVAQFLLPIPDRVIPLKYSN